MKCMIIDILETDFAPESISNYGIIEDPQVCPAILIFARNEQGQSLAIQVNDYKPWVRLEIQERYTASGTMVQLNNQYKTTFEYSTKKLPHFYGYEPSTDNPCEPKQYSYVDIRLNTFKEAQYFQYRHKVGLCDSLQHWTTKFCNDLGIIPSDWIEIPDTCVSDTHWSTCDIEYKVPWKSIQYIEKNSICPIKIMSFDCEMYSHDGLFPSVKKKDFTNMLCATIQAYGSKDIRKVALVVLPEMVLDFPKSTDGGADGANGALEIQTFKTSYELLEGFRDLIVREDPDILTGWNIYGFDFQFMYEDYLQASNQGLTDTKALFCSRVRSWESKYVEQQMKSAAKGDNTYRYWKMDGRICVDLMQIIKDDKKPEDNTLKHIAGLFLDPNFGKLDLTPHEMFEAFRTGNTNGLVQTMHYCVRDAEIPLLLIEKLVYVPSWIEMSRVCFTNLFAVLNGGQQRRVFNVISRFIHNKYALNEPIKGLWPVEDTDDDSRAPQYQGATVIEPITGFYQTPVSVLDFESLYPSIMIYFNLCPSVYLGYQEKGLTTTAVEHDLHEIKFDQGLPSRKYAFAKHTPGVLPQLLRHLLKSRKAVKALMNTSNDPFEKFVLNGRQSALKVVCNSVYGFMGVSDKKGLLPCKPIAAVTTMKGRAFIDRAKQHVEEHWPGSKVLYGDTDSIMVLWPLKDSSGTTITNLSSNVELTPSKKPLTIAEAYENGNLASKAITDVLQLGTGGVLGLGGSKESRMAVKLANEKVECPYLLIGKKMYAAVKWTPKTATEFSSELEYKGIDAVRRDRTKIVRELSEAVLTNLLVHNDIKNALKLLQDGLNSIVENKVPLEDYVLSKSLKGSYASENLPHVQAYKRMRQRGDPGLPPLGSRMPMLFITPKNPKNVKLYEIAEHPEYVRLKNLRPWAYYYIHNIRNVMERLFEPTQIKVSKYFDDAEARANHITSRNRSLLDMMSNKKLKIEE